MKPKFKNLNSKKHYNDYNRFSFRLFLKEKFLTIANEEASLQKYFVVCRMPGLYVNMWEINQMGRFGMWK